MIFLYLQIEERESRFKNMPAWKRALVEKKEKEAEAKFVIVFFIFLFFQPGFPKEKSGYQTGVCRADRLAA